MSILRSVSPIHIEYLRNMGVAASMSVSISGQNKLWGLFACHHYRRTSALPRRTAAELFGQMFSLLIENREREEEAAYEARAQKLHQQLVTVMATEATRFESIVAHLDDIADLLTCDGIGVWVNGRATLKGLTPDEQQFAALVAYLQRKDISEIYARHDIGAEYPDGAHFAERAAGMLAVPLSRPPGDYLVFFRKEVARAVNWAGDPTKPVTVGPAGRSPHAAQEFRAMAGDGERPGAHWTPVECRIAEACASACWK